MIGEMIKRDIVRAVKKIGSWPTTKEIMSVEFSRFLEKVSKELYP